MAAAEPSTPFSLRQHVTLARTKLQALWRLSNPAPEEAEDDEVARQTQEAMDLRSLSHLIKVGDKARVMEIINAGAAACVRWGAGAGG